MQTDRDSKDTSVSKKKNVGKEGHAHLPNLGEEFEKLRRLRRIAFVRNLIIASSVFLSALLQVSPSSADSPKALVLPKVSASSPFSPQVSAFPSQQTLFFPFQKGAAFRKTLVLQF